MIFVVENRVRSSVPSLRIATDQEGAAWSISHRLGERFPGRWFGRGNSQWQRRWKRAEIPKYLYTSALGPFPIHRSTLICIQKLGKRQTVLGNGIHLTGGIKCENFSCLWILYI